MAYTSSNPILKQIKLPRLGLFSKPPGPRPGVALVLFRPGQPLVTLKPGQKLTLGEMRFGRYTTAYEVDLSEKSFEFSCSLPSQNPAYEFQADVRVSYRVDNPAAVVEHQVTDPPATLQPLIIRTLRNKSREFPIEAVHEAEPGLTHTLRQANYGRGLKITEAIVTLKLDASARDYVRKRDAMERQKQIELESIRHQKELQREKAELERQLEEQRQQLLQQRLRFYNPLIQSGNWQMLGLMLANNPEDIATVAQMVREQRQQDFENFLRAIQVMVEGDVLESFDLEPAKRRLLEGFVETFTSRKEEFPTALPDTHEHKALSPGEEQAEQGDAVAEPEDQAADSL